MSLADWRARGRKRGKQLKHPAHGRRSGLRSGLTCEALEERRVLAVSLAPIPGPDSGVFNVPSGKDLYVPLTSIDLGNTVTYTATSSNANVTVQILNGNPTLQLNVTGTDNTGTAFSGVLTIQLFEDLAPETVDQISSLVSTGFYNGLSFYRIVPDFVIQGGANGTKTAPTFDDEFNVNLSFNSPGLLAMANPGTANSNTSEFFITDIDEPLGDLPLYLNFRHSIFGQLTSGFDTYLKIMNAQGTSSSDSSPSSPITITSASIITDTQNGVVRISEADGFTGTSTITVTAHSSDGTSTDTETFSINAAPLTQVSSNHPLLLNTVADQTTNAGQAVSFQISANQLFSGNLDFSVSGTSAFNANPSNVTVTVSNVTATSATITLTPAAGFTGVINLVAHADDGNRSLHDAQEFTLTVVGSLAISSVTNPINAANDNSVTISGNSGVGNTISVVASDGTNTTAAQTVTVGSNGLWTINNFDVSALADGTITFTATDLTVGGTDTITATKDTVFPALQITSVTSPIGAANKNAVVMSGTGEAGRTVTLQIAQGQIVNTAYSTTVNANGTWTITGIDLSAFSNGIVSFTASSADAAGNNAQTSTTSTIDTVAPTVDITTVTDPVTLGNATSTSASGTGEVGATISLVVTDGTNTTTTYTATVAANGTWSITGIDVSDLLDGTITYRATASDEAGNTAVDTQTSTKSAVSITTITSPINASNDDNTSVSGTGRAGAEISLVVTDGTNTTIEYTTTVASNGTWSISGVDVSALDDGDITYNVTATFDEQTAVHSKTVTKDTTPPAVDIVSATDPINAANAAATFVNGTTEAGATISIVASDGTNATAAKTATANGSGTWAVTGIDVTSLDDGTITYTITVTDTAGNTTVTTRISVKDTVAPTVNITQATSPINIANADSITVSGTGDPGANISVVVSDGTNATAAVTTTVSENGTWTVSGIDVSNLADGTITYTATITDAAFNTATDTQTATKATVDITVVTNPVNLSNRTNVTVSGTGEVGATVSVVATDGTNTTSAVTTTIGANGTWSISGINLTALADGTITFTATATDDEENSAQATITTTKDTVAPVLTISSVTDPINNATAVVVSGTGQAGATVTVTVTDGTHTTTQQTVTVGSNGTWQISNIDVTALNDGTVTVNATSSDEAGNSSQASKTATKTAAATASLTGRVYIDANGNGSFDDNEGGVAGVILTLRGTDAQGNAIASRTTTSGANGVYTFSSLPAGTYSITMSRPTKFSAGTSTAGSLGGTAGTLATSGIAVATGNAGTGYNFGIGQLDESMISARLMLASTPPLDQLFANIVNQYGIAAPVVMSIVKADADPTTSASLRFTITFNEDVTGVDTGDFAVVGSTTASIASITGSGKTYTVTVNRNGATGNIGLRLVDNDTIASSAAVKLGGTGTGNGDFVGPSYSTSNASTSVDVSTVTDPINNSNKSNVTASGTGEAGATISLVATDGTNSTSAMTTTVAANGTWSITGINVSNLNDGTLTFNVTATKTGGGTATDSKTAVKDTVAPAVAVTTTTNPINASNDENVSSSGTGEAGATIELVVTDGTHSTSTLSTTVGSNGTWSINSINLSTFNDGTITFNVTARDAAGNTATSSKTASKDTVAPTVAITSGTQQINAEEATAATASGTGEAGANISLVVSDGTTSTSALTTTVAENGTWTITGINVSGLDDGTLTVTVTATDAAGNSATDTETATLDTTPPDVEITSILDPITIANHDATSIGGTGEVDASISVVVSDGTNSTTAVTTTVAGDGTWSLTNINTASLDDGVLTYTVTATDAVGNTATDTLTATKRTVAITSVSDPINEDNNDNVTVSGTGEVGAEISLVVSDGTDTTTTYTTTVGQDGTWSITGVDVSELDDGTLTFTATATDEDDNTAQATFTAEKDTVAPAVALSTVTDPIDEDNETIATASGTGEAGAEISLVASDGTTTIDAVVTSVSQDGTWSIIDIDVSGLDDGTITFTATATDSFGNSADASKTATKSTSTAPLVDMVMGEEDDWT